MFKFFKTTTDRGNKTRAAKQKRGLRLESLELRQLMAADLGVNDRGAALDLSVSSQVYAVPAQPPSKNLSKPVTEEVKSSSEVSTEVQVFNANGVLTIKGSNSGDTITIKKSGSAFQISASWTPAGGAKKTLTKSVSTSGITNIVIVGEGGNDIIDVQESVSTWTRIFGGAGSDTIKGGAGIDNIYGGGGNDFLYGRGGGDVLYGGAGSDTVDGGSGSNSVYQGSPSRTYSMNTFEKEVVRLVNIERKNQGLPALTADSLLANAAKTQANQMAARNAQIGRDGAHNHFLTGVTLPSLTSRIDYVGFEWASSAENIAWKSNGHTAASLVNAWMNSPGHRNNILSATSTHLGVGATQAADGSWYYAQVFGSKLKS